MIPALLIRKWITLCEFITLSANRSTDSGICDVELEYLHIAHVREVVPRLRHVVGTDANQGTRLCQNPRRLQADPRMTLCEHTHLSAKLDSRGDFFDCCLGTESGVQWLLIRLHIRDSEWRLLILRTWLLLSEKWA
jgi:hypothetical protein